MRGGMLSPRITAQETYSGAALVSDPPAEVPSLPPSAQRPAAPAPAPEPLREGVCQIVYSADEQKGKEYVKRRTLLPLQA